MALIALVIVLFVILAWVIVKWLFIIAVILALVWAILFFWRGISGRGRRSY